MKRMAILCALLAAGCASPERSQERAALSQGLLPNLSDHGAPSAIGAIGAALQEAENETNLLKAYAIRAGVIETPTERLPAPGSPDWYFITEAGMNDIGQKCEAYVDAIFQLRRDLATAKDQISLAGATTATVLGVFGAAAEAIAATAAGFGFATQGIANASENILFTVDPSGVRKLIGRQQAAYREQVRTARAAFDNRPAAVQAVQGYLATCLPSTIEMQINESVSLTDFFVPEGATGANVVLERRATTETRAPLPEAGSGPADAGREPVRPEPAPASAPGCAGPECSLSSGQVADVQAALCIPPGERAFAFGPKTRAAIAAAKRQPAAPGLFETAGTGLTFLEAARLASLPSCPAAFGGALERFAFGTPGDDYASVNADVFRLAVDRLKADGVSFTGGDPAGFTPAFREGLRGWQAGRGLAATGVIDVETFEALL